MHTLLALEHLPRRDELARLVQARLRAAPHVVDVKTYGSHAAGRADQFSDLDFAVTVRGISDREFAHALPGLLDPIGPRLVDGWGLAFLPDSFVRTFYFAAYPLFWHVDIGCLSDRHADGSDIKAAYHWPQIFKMWIDVVKDWARGIDRVDEFGAHIGRWANVAAVQGTQAQRLAAYLVYVQHVRAIVVHRARSCTGVAPSLGQFFSGSEADPRINTNTNE